MNQTVHAVSQCWEIIFEMVSSFQPRVLLLQGPVGPFFSELQTELNKQDVYCQRVLFNFADAFYTKHKNVIPFKKKVEFWEPFLSDLIDEHKINTIVIFGCERDRHESARVIAAEKGVKIISLEEGYFRPGFISVELNGNNRFSPIVEKLKQELDGKGIIENSTHLNERKPSSGTGLSKVVWLAIFYYNLRAIGSFLYPYQAHHRKRPLASEAFFWIRNLVRKNIRRNKNKIKIINLIEKFSGKYFIVPLQVSDDMQIVKASRGWDNSKLIYAAIASFSKHAPKGCKLVIKVHPLERGHRDYKNIVDHAAEMRNCEEDIILIDDGLMDELSLNSCGMLTINSGSAYYAIQNSIPVGVMGDALFRHPKLVSCIETNDDIDKFWTQKEVCEPHIAKWFLNYIRSTALFPGDYYRKNERKIAVQEIVKQLKLL